MSCVNPHLAHLDEVGNHDDSCHPLLPDHAPEVVRRLRQWALRGDPPMRAAPPNPVCIDVPSDEEKASICVVGRAVGMCQQIGTKGLAWSWV